MTADTEPVKTEDVIKTVDLIDALDTLDAFDQEAIPHGGDSYTNLGRNLLDRDDLKQKKRRANRLKRKKKDKHRYDRD